MSDYLKGLAIQQINTIDSDTRLVVIHPNYLQPHTLLNCFLGEEGVIYLRLETQVTTVDALFESLHAEIQHQTAQDQLPDNATVILDETDRPQPELLDEFLRQLLDRLPQGRVIVIGRDIPICALKDEVIQSTACFVPVDPETMLWDYTEVDDNHLLEVRAFGTGHVLVNGRRINSWDGLLPRSLFFYLVDRGMATRNDIFATFWPKLTTREATNVFHVTKRKINEVLGIDLTTYWSGYYRISPQINLSYDAVLFNELAQNSEIAEADQIEEMLLKAMALYRGPFLAATDMQWVKRRRSELILSYSDVLSQMAAVTEENGDLAQALSLYLRATSMNRRREDTIEHIMRLYNALDMPEEALETYEQLEQELRSSFKMTPNMKLREFAASIRSDIGLSKVEQKAI